MADSMDRRSEGKSSNSDKMRKYRERIAQGLCANCGKVPVVNRKICYGCVDRMQVNNMKSMIRRWPMTAITVLAGLGYTNIFKEKNENGNEA